jgi:hypothetical protein
MPGAAAVVARLIGRVEFDEWYRGCRKVLGGRTGKAKLEWPADQESRLGLQLALFRAFADERLTDYDFAANFFNGQARHHGSLAEMTKQVFEPLATELRHYLTHIAPSIGPKADANRSEDDPVVVSLKTAQINLRGRPGLSPAAPPVAARLAAMPPVTGKTVSRVIATRAVLTHQAQAFLEFLDQLTGPEGVAPADRNAPTLAEALEFGDALSEDELLEALRELRDELRRLNTALEGASAPPETLNPA